MGLVDEVIAAQLPTPARRRSIRVTAGVSLRDMAKELGVNTMTVLRWERDEVAPRRANAMAYRRLLEDLAGATR